MRSGRDLDRRRPVRRAALLGASLALLLVDGPAMAAPTAPTVRGVANAAQVAPSSAGTTLKASRTPSSASPKRALRTAAVSRIKFGASAREYRARESVRLRGRVFAGSNAVGKGTKVQIWREKASGKTKRIATLRTNKKGKFSYRIRAGKSASFQARADGE